MESAKAINRLIKPYKDKINAIRTMLGGENSRMATQANFFSAGGSQHAINSGFNFASYSHMSRLRNTINLFSLRATADKLVLVMGKFKDVEVQVVKQQLQAKQLVPAFEKAMSQFKP